MDPNKNSEIQEKNLELDKEDDEQQIEVDDNSFEVEKVLYFLNEKYLVKWKYYSMDDNTWEPRSSFCEVALKKIEDYYKFRYLITKGIRRNDVAPVLFIERIISEKPVELKGKRYLNVKWRGFPMELSTCEPVEYLKKYYDSDYELWKNPPKVVPPKKKKEEKKKRKKCLKPQDDIDKVLKKRKQKESQDPTEPAKKKQKLDKSKLNEKGIPSFGEILFYYGETTTRGFHPPKEAVEDWDAFLEKLGRISRGEEPLPERPELQKYVNGEIDEI